MVPEDNKKLIPNEQLQRSLQKVIYHFKTKENDGGFLYKSITYSSEDFDNHTCSKLSWNNMLVICLINGTEKSCLIIFEQMPFIIPHGPHNNKRKATIFKLTKAESSNKNNKR